MKPRKPAAARWPASLFLEVVAAGAAPPDDDVPEPLPEVVLAEPEPEELEPVEVEAI